MATANNAPLLEMSEIGKTFPGVRALDGVTFDVVFRVVDLAGNTVLQSDCLTVTVK